MALERAFQNSKCPSEEGIPVSKREVSETSEYSGQTAEKETCSHGQDKNYMTRNSRKNLKSLMILSIQMTVMNIYYCINYF